MKILLCNRPGGAFGYITDGWKNALTYAGFEVKRWNGKPQEWSEFDPDLYIGSSGHRQPIPSNRRAKVALHVNPYGKSVRGIDEEPKVIEWVKRQRPDVVFGYGSEDHVMYWANWTTKLRLPWVPMPTAGDSTYYRRLPTQPSSELVYLGGRWPYKAKNIDQYILPLLKRHTYTLAGWGSWPDNVTVASVTDGQENEFYSNGIVAPCVSEPHTTETGIDVPERVFKAVLCGKLAVHDHVAKFRSYLKTVPSAIDPDDYRKHVSDILRMSPEQQLDLANSQYEEVLSKHTYFARMRTLFKELGFQEEAEKLKASANALHQSLSKS